MIGENEHEFERESAGDPTPPDPSMPEAEAEPGDSGALDRADDLPRKRRFGAWGAARREEPAPSLWHRASQKIKQIFARPKKDEPEIVAEDAAPTSDELPYLVAPEQPVEAGDQADWRAEERTEAPSPAAESLSIPVIPPAGEPEPEPEQDQRENLKFLWSAKEGPSAEPVDAAPSDEFGAPADAVESGEANDLAEPIAEPPREKRPSFFKRLFGKKSRDPEEEIPDTNESEIPVEASHEPDMEVATPAHEEPAYSDFAAPQTEPPEPEAVHAESAPVEPALDEALPMDEPHVESADAEPVVEATTDDFGAEPFGAEPEPEPPRKPGFFARLFGRKPAEPPAIDVVAEPEGEHDAVVVLDAVDQGFEAARSEFAPPEHAPDRSFSSVEDALPLDATMDIQPAVTASSFAPPPPSEPAAPPAAAAGDEHMFFGGNTFDFESPKDDRSTVEVTPVGDDRKTAEVSAVPDIAAHADEVERKTDEFEMIELDGATLQEPAVSPLEGKTAEVPKVGLLKKLFSRTKEVTQVEPAVAPPPSANPTFLVQKFRTFYNEVVVYKNQKTEFTAGFATAIVTDYTADLSPEQAAQSLAVRLQQMLELQLAESSWMGGEVQELYPDAQYAMACLADEMLTNLEWPGQSAWGKHRLELTVFKTVASELEVFKRIDKLLKNGPRTVGTRDLARVYLLVIASGFLGKYRPFKLPRALAEYRRRLYEFVYDGDALMLYAGERRIFPEATSSTVAGRGVKRISMAQQWAAILVLLLVSYTVISHFAWKKVSADLKDIAARVEQARNTPPADSPNGGGGR